MQNYPSLLFDSSYTTDNRTSIKKCRHCPMISTQGFHGAMQCFECCYYLLLSFHFSWFAVVSDRSLYYWYMVCERTVITVRL